MKGMEIVKSVKAVVGAQRRSQDPDMKDVKQMREMKGPRAAPAFGRRPAGRGIEVHDREMKAKAG